MSEQLFQLGGGFFNQDWDDDYENPDDAIVGFRDGQSRKSNEELLREIDLVLASTMDESQLEHLWLDESGAYYEPIYDGFTYREWFAHVRELLTAT